MPERRASHRRVKLLNGSMTAPVSARDAMKDLPPVIYAARLEGGVIKIGWTADLADRIRRYGKTARIIAFIPGSKSDELAVHRRLRPSVVEGREYYAPTDEVLDAVNGMRRQLGLNRISS